MSETAASVYLPGFQFGAWHRSRDSVTLLDGATLAIAPDIAIITERRMRVAAPERFAPDALAAILRAAVREFRAGHVMIGERSEDFASFANRLRQCQGVPAFLSAAWADQLVEIVDAMTSKAPPEPSDRDVMISLPANTFLCLESVFAALWHGNRLFLRLSQREPYSALRLTAALLAVGVPPSSLIVAALSHDGLSSVLPHFDHALLYGGQDLLPLARDPQRIDVKGPGRAAAWVAGDASPAAAQAAARLVARSAGRLCSNVRTLMVERNPDRFAEALASAISARVGLADPECCAPIVVDPAAVARQRADLLALLRHGDRIVCGGSFEPVVGKTIAPLIVRVAHIADHPLRLCEPGFPFAIVGEGAAPTMDDTLVYALFVSHINDRGEVARLRVDGENLLEGYAA